MHLFACSVKMDLGLLLTDTMLGFVTKAWWRENPGGKGFVFWFWSIWFAHSIAEIASFLPCFWGPCSGLLCLQNTPPVRWGDSPASSSGCRTVVPSTSRPPLPLRWFGRERHLPVNSFHRHMRAHFQQFLPARHHSKLSAIQWVTAMLSAMRSVSLSWGTGEGVFSRH